MKALICFSLAALIMIVLCAVIRFKGISVFYPGLASESQVSELKAKIDEQQRLLEEIKRELEEMKRK